MGMNKRIYRAKASHWGLGESGTGKEQVAVGFDILTEGATEKALTWYGYFTDATFDRTIESLRACGWTGDDLGTMTGLDANEVELVVEDEEYDGRTTAKVQWVNKPGSMALKAPLSVERTKVFAAQMRDRIRALDASKGAKPATSKPTAAKRQDPPPHTDSDRPPF